jgi:hypothetical protein
MELSRFESSQPFHNGTYLHFTLEFRFWQSQYRLVFPDDKNWKNRAHFPRNASQFAPQMRLFGQNSARLRQNFRTPEAAGDRISPFVLLTRIRGSISTLAGAEPLPPQLVDMPCRFRECGRSGTGSLIEPLHFRYAPAIRQFNTGLTPFPSSFAPCPSAACE